MKKKNKEQKLWLLVIGSALVIVLIWAFALKYNWQKQQSFVSFNWPDFSSEEETSWSKFQDNLETFSEFLDGDPATEETEVTAVSEKQIINNPNNLSEEEIENLEKEIFPEKKDAQKE